MGSQVSGLANLEVIAHGMRLMVNIFIYVEMLESSESLPSLVMANSNALALL